MWCFCGGNYVHGNKWHRTTGTGLYFLHEVCVCVGSWCSGGEDPAGVSADGWNGRPFCGLCLSSGQNHHNRRRQEGQRPVPHHPRHRWDFISFIYLLNCGLLFLKFYTNRPFSQNQPWACLAHISPQIIRTKWINDTLLNGKWLFTFRTIEVFAMCDFCFIVITLYITIH